MTRAARPARPTRKRCPCGAPVLWALDDGGRWVDVDPQASLDRLAPDPLVLWGEPPPGDEVQRVSRLEDFERANGGAYPGPVWHLHFQSCPEADRRIPWTLSARGRRLLELMSGGRRNGGAAS